MRLRCTLKLKTSQTYDIMVNKVDEGNPEVWIVCPTQMESILVSQDVKDAPNIFSMIKYMIRGKELIDFEGSLSVICEVGKQDVADTNLQVDDNATQIVYDSSSALTDENLADCLLIVTKEVFLTQETAKQRRYMRRYMSKSRT